MGYRLNTNMVCMLLFNLIDKREEIAMNIFIQTLLTSLAFIGLFALLYWATQSADREGKSFGCCGSREFDENCLHSTPAQHSKMRIEKI